MLRNLSHTLAALTGNCGDFRAAWEQADGSPEKGERWTGEWISQENGHRGALRCVLRRREGGDFEAMFHARYARFLRVCYTVALHGARVGEAWRLEGEADLGGLAGGVYTYRGELAGATMTCAYACRYDRGIFELRAVKHD